MIHSFRFGDSYRISKLCELVKVWPSSPLLPPVTHGCEWRRWDDQVNHVPIVFHFVQQVLNLGKLLGQIRHIYVKYSNTKLTDIWMRMGSPNNCNYPFTTKLNFNLTPVIM